MTYPSRTSDQYALRFPDGLRETIKRAAMANRRSMNAEIVAVLEAHYGRSNAMPPEIAELIACLREAVTVIDDEIEQRKNSGNHEDWSALADLSDRSRSAIAKAEGAA